MQGEKLTALPSLSGFLAVGYLALFGSIIAINAYMYLIRNGQSGSRHPATPTLNPVVAVLLGTGLDGETLSKIEWLALGVIVFAVVLVTLGKYLFPAKPVVAPVIQDASKRVNESPACRSARWHLRRRSTLPDAR
ncbi:putative DMT superfamily transporter inner membrane protein [Escherichia coli]|uniref:Putative DMT superfamily transporter inner membrane protein n=1 Tax=Escherichia coli TaxID=562 RepID=A0A376KVW4_ECOLX|nr:putative DMT superfamily transporter inner membrane protein [Escherichia coli]